MVYAYLNRTTADVHYIGPARMCLQSLQDGLEREAISSGSANVSLEIQGGEKDQKAQIENSRSSDLGS